MRENRAAPPFTSRMSRWETVAALVYLPVHVLLLPRLVMDGAGGRLDSIQLNFVCYLIGALYMLLLQRRFLRRDFDPLCDRPGGVLWEIIVCYGLMIACNLLMSGVFALIDALLANSEALSLAEGNPNNNVIIGWAGEKYNTTAAMAVFLVPVVEELMFRAGIFGLLRRYSRPLAYAAGILLFSVYHVWGYALDDPLLWLYLLQYIPASWLLCRCYERTNSIWGSIFLHMFINFMSLRALSMLQELM